MMNIKGKVRHPVERRVFDFSPIPDKLRIKKRVLGVQPMLEYDVRTAWPMKPIKYTPILPEPTRPEQLGGFLDFLKPVGELLKPAVKFVTGIVAPPVKAIAPSIFEQALLKFKPVQKLLTPKALEIPGIVVVPPTEAEMPGWVLPVGIGAAALILIMVMRKR